MTQIQGKDCHFLNKKENGQILKRRMKKNSSDTYSPIKKPSYFRVLYTTKKAVIKCSHAIDQSRVFNRVTCLSDILRCRTGAYILNSSLTWFFSWLIKPFHMFCQFRTQNKRYRKVMKRI